MSYLNMPGGVPKVGKAVISFWFRVPQKSIDEALAAATPWPGTQIGDNWYFPPFNNKIPLVVMGQLGSLTAFESKPAAVVETLPAYNVMYPNTPTSTHVLVDSGSSPPGFAINPDTGRLEFNLGFRWWIYHDTGNIDGGAGEWVRVPTIDEGGYWDPIKVTTYSITALDSQPANPTFIGIDVVDPPTLYVNLQTGVTPTAKGTREIVSSIEPGAQYGFPSTEYKIDTTYMDKDFGIVYISQAIVYSYSKTPLPPPPPVENKDPVYHWTDVSQFYNGSTAAFTNTGDENATQAVAPDQWHHVLISFEIKPCKVVGTADISLRLPTSTYIQSTSKLWIALDDHNFTENDLSNNWPNGGGPNDVITDDAWHSAGQFGPDHNDNMPLYDAECTSIAGTPLGLPAHAKFVDDIFKVEMAEFQMFTGVTLETGVEANRRAFIDCKRDKNGNPIKEKDGSVIFRPVDPKKAAALLGKGPDILLHGNTKWINGENTGALGITINSDGSKTKNPAGQFTPTGLIKKYKPEPTLVEP